MKFLTTTFKPEDVTICLSDVTSVMRELPMEEREKLIQGGKKHYSEMLPEEKAPASEYMDIYYSAMDRNKSKIAEHVAKLAKMIVARTTVKPVIISLARAGTPIGVLVARYIKTMLRTDCKHYTVSIIRDRGIDMNAMEFIYNNDIKDKAPVTDIFFLDGWTGKGAILGQLEEAVEELKSNDEKWNGLRSDLYVLADPANITDFTGTKEDYSLPSSYLNSTVCGLMSRTILNEHIDVEGGQFHGSVCFEKFKGIDKTNEFLDTITAEFKPIEEYSTDTSNKEISTKDSWRGMTVVNALCEEFDVKDFKLVKPGIGETTRVLLRRSPWKVIINEKVDMEHDEDIQHIVYLCGVKNIPIERRDLGNYKVCGIIKDVSADA